MQIRKIKPGQFIQTANQPNSIVQMQRISNKGFSLKIYIQNLQMKDKLHT